MPAVTSQAIDRFKDFVDIVEEHRATALGPLWYRGASNAAYSLLPSLYRHPTIQVANEIGRLEGELIDRFRQRSLPFHSRNLQNEWENLFFMQHYGVPTRLLDWTENPFMAFFFAAMRAKWGKDAYGSNPAIITDATVWLLDPVAWNRHAILCGLRL